MSDILNDFDKFLENDNLENNDAQAVPGSFRACWGKHSVAHVRYRAKVGGPSVEAVRDLVYDAAYRYLKKLFCS